MADRIDPKALEAAARVLISQEDKDIGPADVAVGSDLDWATAELSDPIAAYLDAADLVPRSDYAEALNELRQEISAHNKTRASRNSKQNERDEALAQIAALREFTHNISRLSYGTREQLDAALDTVLTDAAPKEEVTLVTPVPENTTKFPSG